MKKEIQIMAHRAGSRERPNSREAVEKVLKLKPNIIELDIRLSKDRQLVCYHGNMLEMLGFYSSTNFRTAEELRSRGVSSLSELLSLISSSCDVFLDIKDYGIKPRQIFSVIEGAKVPFVYIGARNAKYFGSFGSKPDNVSFCKIYSFGFERELYKFKKLGIDIVDLLPWMVTKKRADNIHRLRMNFSLSSLFEPELYLKAAAELGTRWISVYDIVFYRNLLTSLHKPV